MARPDHIHTEQLTARKREAAVLITSSGPRCVFYLQKYRTILRNTTWECNSFFSVMLVKGEFSIVCLYLRLNKKKTAKTVTFKQLAEFCLSAIGECQNESGPSINRWNHRAGQCHGRHSAAATIRSWKTQPCYHVSSGWAERAAWLWSLDVLAAAQVWAVWDWNRCFPL